MAKGSVGVPAGIRSIAPVELRQIKQTVKLSKEARLRLAWMDYYHNHSQNAALTARHYGIARSCFFKWKKRFDLRGVRGLEDYSRRPKLVRSPLTPMPVVNAIKSLRKANPEFSKYKLAVILKRDHGFSVSASTVGRVISRYQLFYPSPIRPKGHPGRNKHTLKMRKPKGLAAVKPGDLIEVDVKHLPFLGSKKYGFVAIDVVSKQASIYVSTSISSAQGALAWKRAVHELGLPRAVLTDNGSENMGAFRELVATQDTEHYWARPNQPKDKPHVERFIGTLEKECIQWGGVAENKLDQQQLINQWLVKYHNYRPHQALGYLTPSEYKSRITS